MSDDDLDVTCPTCGTSGRPDGFTDDGGDMVVLAPCLHAVEPDPLGICGECGKGVIMPSGPMEADTGHTPVVCTAGCGYWS